MTRQEVLEARAVAWLKAKGKLGEIPNDGPLNYERFAKCFFELGYMDGIEFGQAATLATVDRVRREEHHE